MSLHPPSRLPQNSHLQSLSMKIIQYNTIFERQKELNHNISNENTNKFKLQINTAEKTSEKNTKLKTKK